MLTQNYVNDVTADHNDGMWHPSDVKKSKNSYGLQAKTAGTQLRSEPPSTAAARAPCRHDHCYGATTVESSREDISRGWQDSGACTPPLLWTRDTGLATSHDDNALSENLKKMTLKGHGLQGQLAPNRG